MATYDYVTDHAQTDTLDGYNSGDQINFKDLNGRLVDFDYEKNGNNVVLSTDVQFYATVKVDRDFIVDGHLEQVEGGTWSSSNERKYTEGYGKQSIVNALETGSWKNGDIIVDLATYKQMTEEQRAGYVFQGGTLRLTIQTGKGHSEGTVNSYYFTTGTLYNLENSYKESGQYPYGPQDVHMLFDKTDLERIQAGTYTGTNGFYGADSANVITHYGSDLNVTDLHIYQVVNGGTPIEVTTSYLATAADSAYNQKLYNAEQNDITVTLKDYATDYGEAHKDIYVNKLGEEQGLNLSTQTYGVIADRNYAASWLKEDILVADDAVISAKYAGDSVFFKDLSGDAIDYTATKVEDDVVLSTNIQYYAKVTISANGEENPYVSDSNGKNYMEAGEYTAHLALVNTGAAAGHYMWKVDTPYGNVDSEDRYCFFGIGGDSFNFDAEGNVTSIDPDTFSGLTYQFTGFYEVVNGGDPINVTKGYYDVVEDVDSWETLYAAHQGLFESQGDLTATLDDYATVVYQGADVYANGTDDLSEATYAVNADGSYTATWLKENITTTANADIIFNSTTAAGDTLVFANEGALTYKRNGNDLVITNNVDAQNNIVTTIKNYYTTGDMSADGAFKTVQINSVAKTLADVEKVTDISNVSYFDSGIDVTNRNETVNLTTGLTGAAAIDPDKLVADTDGKVALNGDTNKYEFTSNVGYGKNNLDSYGLGRDGDDTINGTAGNDYIHGGAANDAVFGGVNATGHDMLAGGLGDDLVVAGELATSTTQGAVKVAEDTYAVLSNGTAELYGDAGNDTLVGGKGNDYLWGGAGNNTLTGGAGADTFDFTAREGGVFDTITDATKDDTIAIYGPNFKDMTFERGTGEQENDLIITVVGEGEGIGTGDTLTVKGYFDQAEADRVTKFQVGGELYNLEWHYSNVDKEYHMYNVTHNPNGATVEGIRNWVNGWTTEDVNITGSSAGDMLAGSLGNDTITASAGASELYGDAGNDKLIGGVGADYIRGNAGNDTLTGNGGADTFAVESGADVITDATSIDKIRFVDDYRTDFTGITFAKGEGEKATSLMVSFGENSSVEIQNYFNANGSVAEGHVNKFILVTNGGDKEYTLEWLHSNVDKADYMYNVTSNTEKNLVEGIRNWVDGYTTEVVSVTGVSAGDMLAGSIKDDTITAGDGGAELYGDAGDDLLSGGAGNDYIQGGSGDDDLYGYGGNDKLITRDGTDKAYGGSGDDHFFIDGAGTKTIGGEEGADTYHIVNLSAVSNITADAYDNITFDYSNYKFSDLKFTRDGSDLVISFEKTDNTGKVNVKGFFTAESKIDTINALNDENTPELTAYSILNNADIYVDLTQVDGAYQATDYREVFYGTGTVNGFNNAKDSVESASPVLARTNNSTALTIDNITITDFDFDTMHPFAIRNGVESQSSTYFPINVTLSDKTEYQATGYAEKISGVGSVNLAGDHPFDRSQDAISVDNTVGVKFTREDNGDLHVVKGGTDIAVKGFNFAGSTDFDVTDGTTTILTAGQTIDVTLTGALEGSYVSASGYPERITTVGSSAIQFYPEGHGKDTLVFDTDSKNVYCERIGNNYVITNSGDAENPVVTTVLNYYTSGDMSVEGRFAGVGMEATGGEAIATTTLGEITIEKISNVPYFDSGIWSTDRDETVVLTKGLTTAAAIDPEKLEADSEGTVTVGTGDHAGKYVFTSNAGHGTHELDSYALGRAGDDVITGTDGTDWIHGGLGDDNIYGGTGGHDMLAGGDGKNHIVAGDYVGNEMVLNKDGVEIYGGKDKDVIQVGGNDTTENYIWAHGGDDDIYLQGGKNTIMLAEDDNTAIGSDTIYGATKNDLLKFVSAQNAQATINKGYKFSELTFDKSGNDLTITTKDGNVVTIDGYFAVENVADRVNNLRVIAETGGLQADAQIIRDAVFDVVVNNEGFDKATSPYAGYRVNIQLAEGATSASVSGLGEGDNIDIPANYTLSRVYTDADTTENNVLRINDGLIKIQSHNFESTPAFTIGGTPVMVGAPLDVYLDNGTYTTTNAFSENIHGRGSVAAAALQAGTNDKLLLTEGATVGYSRINNGNLVVTAGTGESADRITVTGFDFTGGHDIKVNDGTTAGMTINVFLDSADYISASGYAEKITTLADSTVQFYPEGQYTGKDTLVFADDAKLSYSRNGNDLIIANGSVETTVKNYYTSGDMSERGQFYNVDIQVGTLEPITLASVEKVTYIEGVSYFDSGIWSTNRDETVVLTKGLTTGTEQNPTIDPAKLSADSEGTVTVGTGDHAGKYVFTSNAGHGTHELDTYALGRAGKDYIFGTDGNDWIHGGAGDDSILGGTAGHDMLAGGDGENYIVAGDFVDSEMVLNKDGVEIYGGKDRDAIHAGGDENTQNYIWAHGGDDIILLEGGQNTIMLVEDDRSSAGNDTITGASALDTLKFVSRDGKGDVISGYNFADLTFTKDGNNLIITTPNDNTVTIVEYFTATSKVDIIKTADRVDAHSIKNDAVFNIDLDKIEGHLFDKSAAGYTGYHVNVTGEGSVANIEKDDILNSETEDIKRSGNDLVLDTIIVKDYYTSGDMSVAGKYADAKIKDGELISLLSDVEKVTDIEGVSYFDSGIWSTDRDETIELTKGLTTAAAIDPEKLEADSEGTVTVGTGDHAGKYVFTSNAGHGTHELDSYALGRAGKDYIFGTDGNDWIHGGAGDDIISGGTAGHDMLAGGDGENYIVAGDFVGSEIVLNKDGVEIYGGKDRDAINAGGDDNTQNYIWAHGGDDIILLEGGQNTIMLVEDDRSSAGNDIISGASALDTLKFVSRDGKGDVISGYNFADLTFTKDGYNLIITTPDDNTVTIAEYFTATSKVDIIKTADQVDAHSIKNDAVFNIDLDKIEGHLFDKSAAGYTGYKVNVTGEGFVANIETGDKLNSAITKVNRSGNDLVLDTITVKDYYTSGDMSVAGKYAEVSINPGTLGISKLGQIEVTDISNVSYFDSGIDVTDRDETISLTTGLTGAAAISPAKLAADTDGKVVLNGDKYEFTSNVGYGKHNLDSYGLGRAGEDVINGTAGNDWIHGGADDDAVFGGVNAAGHDMLAGGTGDDLVVAGEIVEEGTPGAINIGTPDDPQYVLLSNGTAELYGDDGDDILVGGKGNDYLWGGAGDNTLTGGAGADTFDFTVLGKEGAPVHDTITDASNVDTLGVYRKAFADLTFDKSGNDLVISADANNTVTVQEFFTTDIEDRIDAIKVGGVETPYSIKKDAVFNIELANGEVFNKPESPYAGYRVSVSGNGYVMGMEDGDKLAIGGNVEYSRINGGGLTVSGISGELLLDKITVMDFAFINDGEHDINVNDGTTADITINVTIKNDYTYDATTYPEVISGKGFVKGMTADDSIVDGTGPAVFSRFNEGGLIINDNLTVLDFFENGVDFKVNGVSTEDANIGVVLTDYAYTATRYAETISGTGSVAELGDNDKLVVDAVSYARENNGGLIVGGAITVNDFDFAGEHDINVNNGTTAGMTIDVTLTGILGAPYISASGYAERITTVDSTAIQFYPEGQYTGQDTLVFNTSADNLDYARDGKDLIITNGEVVTTVLGYYDSYRMEDAGLFSTVIVDTTTTDTTLGALPVTDIYNVSKVKGTNADEVIQLTKVGADEVLTQPEGNDFPNYNPTTGEYTSNATGVTAKVESYAYASGGNDKVYGTDGNDWINGAVGNDELYGGTDGYDMLSGEAGNDVIFAGKAVAPGSGDAVEYRGIVDDSIYNVKLSEGSAEIYGGDGSDLLVGGNGDDFIIGGAGDDTIYGNDGDDLIAGNAGNDTIYGGAGADEIYTGAGTDTIDAGKGDDDIVINGVGTKTITGGEGYDTYHINDTNAVITIADATSADKISFAEIENFGFNNLDFAQAQNEKDLVITYKNIEGAMGKVVVEGYFEQEEADRLTTFNVKGTEYTLKWLWSNNGEAMFNFTNDPNKLVNGFQNWLQDADPMSPDYGVGIVVSGKDEYDHLSGTDYSDIIEAGKNGAEIYAGKGSDVVYGNTGSDYLSGGEGNDNIYLNGEHTGGDDIICLVNSTGDLKAIGNDTIYGADKGDILKFALMNGKNANGYHFEELTFNRVGDNLEIVAGTANANEIPNKAIVDGFFTADNPVDTIYAANQANQAIEGYSILAKATINVDLSQFEGTCKATKYKEIFTGSGSVEGVKDDDKIVVDGTPVYTRTDNGGLTISTYSESGLLVNEITVEDFNFAGGHDITVNDGTTAGMTIGVKLTDALDGTYIAAAGYKENIEVIATKPVNVLGLGEGDNIDISTDFTLSRVYTDADTTENNVLRINDGSIKIQSYNFESTPAFTIGGTTVAVGAPLDVYLDNGTYTTTDAFSENIHGRGSVAATALLDGTNDKLLLTEGQTIEFSRENNGNLIVSSRNGGLVPDRIEVTGFNFAKAEGEGSTNINVNGNFTNAETVINVTLTGGFAYTVSAYADIITGDGSVSGAKESTIVYMGDHADDAATCVGNDMTFKYYNDDDETDAHTITVKDFFDGDGKITFKGDCCIDGNKAGEYEHLAYSDLNVEISGRTKFSNMFADEEGLLHQLFNTVDITGTDNDDEFTGGSGSDTLAGGKGDDTLTGGYGADTFVISAGADTITDAKAEDNIKFAGKFAKLETDIDGTSLIIKSGEDDSISVTIENYFDENGKVVEDAVDTLYALNPSGKYAEYSIADVLNPETYIDFTDYNFDELTFKRNVAGEHPADLVIYAGDEIRVYENYFTDKNPEDNIRTKDGKFSVLADAEIFVTPTDDGYTGTKYNETIDLEDAGDKIFDMKTGVDKLNFTFEECDTETEPDFVMGDFIVKVTKDEQMYLNVPDKITVGEKDYDILQEFTVEGKDLVINVRYNSNEFIEGADPEYEHLGSITVKDAAGKNTGADIFVRNDGVFENVNTHAFIEYTEAEVTDKNTLTGSTLADNIDVSHYITENGKGVKIDSKSGNDVIVGSNYNDTVKASSLEGEFATVTEYGGTNKITTGKGNDIIEAKDYSSNTINAGAGNNIITLSSVGKNTVTAKDGRNLIMIDDGSNNVKVGKGNNMFDINAGTNTIKTGAGENVFYIDNGVNKITSGKKQDRFYIEGGNNTISSGAGEDRYVIEGGSNTIKTGNAASWFYLAERVNDDEEVYVNNITSGSKDDTFIISDGQNNIKSGSGVDKFYIGYSADPITANPVRDDAVNGGYNVINGGAGEDIFFINSGKSALNGAKGNDRYEVNLTDFNFNAGQIVVTDTAGKNILNAVVDKTDGTHLDTLNVFFDVTVKTNKAGTKFKGASYSDMTFTTDVADADGFDDLNGIDVSSKKAFTTINTYDGEGASHSATISTKELDKLASDVAGWLFNKGYASTDDVFANEKTDGDIEALVAKYTTFSANDYKMQ